MLGNGRGELTRWRFRPRARCLTIWDVRLAGFLGAMLILATRDGALFVNTLRLLGNSARVTQTYRVISRIDDLTTAHADAARTSRGYVMTGSTVRLNSYKQVQGQINQTVADLRDLTAEHPGSSNG